MGHGTQPAGDLVTMLAAAGVRRVVDVRIAPGSRKHPQFNREALAGSLRGGGIAYEWRKDLGGFRKARAGSPHTALRNESLRGYADHMDTPEFGEALDWLVETSATTPTAILCSETVWWRCHRSMVADAVVARGHEVGHVLPGGRIDAHRLRDVARVQDGRPVYDVDTGQGRLVDDGPTP